MHARPGREERRGHLEAPGSARGGLARSLVALYLRLALGIGFLSAVADRIGFWGEPGERNVAWGSFERFLDYTATLNFYWPAGWIEPLGWFVTFAELFLGVMLILGYFTRQVAVASGVLLALFALGMSLGTGVKTALDASVFSASAGAFALAFLTRGRFGLDALRRGESAERGYARSTSLPVRWLVLALVASVVLASP